VQFSDEQENGEKEMFRYQVQEAREALEKALRMIEVIKWF